MNITERTLKMVMATVLSIIIADHLHLEFASSAGIIALLSILDTKKSSIKVAVRRFLSFFLAFLIAVIIFKVLGYHLIAFSVYLFLTIPLLYAYKLESGLVPITVLVSHLWAHQSTSLSILSNELLLFIIGTGIALLFNSYMGSNQRQIVIYHQKIEGQMKTILFEMEKKLLGKSDAPIMVAIEGLDADLDQALKLVYRDSHNQLFHSTNYEVHYFEMRKHQKKLLTQMFSTISKLSVTTRQSVLLAHLIHETASQLSQGNPALTLIDDIEQLLAIYRQEDLPKTRLEFENRALLFQLLNDLESFILSKTNFYQSYKVIDIDKA
ncbi:aromatic acid exporter family protein [Streptococcus hongkongensis]